MKTYRVTWEIDVEADSPEAAAAHALSIQRNNDPANTATHFQVARYVGRYLYPSTSIDLSEELIS